MKKNKTIEPRFSVRISNAAQNTWAAIASDVEASYGEIALSDAVDCVAEHIELHGDLSKEDKVEFRKLDVDGMRSIVRSAIEGYF